MGSKFVIFNSCFLFFWLCFKGLKCCTCFWFLPMQFNLLGIALVQYVYTLYMHVWFCMGKFFYLETFRLVTYCGTVFCVAPYCRFFLFSWGVINCAWRWYIKELLGYVFLSWFRIVQLSKTIPVQFQNTFTGFILSWKWWKCDFWYFEYTFRVINSDL